MRSKLDRLKAMTRVGAEDADLGALRRFAPTDSTVTPNLVLDLARKGEAVDLVEEAMVWGRSRHGVTSRVADRLIVNVAVEMAGIVPGRISVEVDADLAFDPQGLAERARAMVADCEHRGVARERILIGVPATWEGIAAAELLRSEVVACDLTLVFSLAQAAAAAEASVSVVSARLSTGERHPSGDGDPVAPDAGLVERIVGYYRKHGIGTDVSAASFGSLDEIERLAGIARLSLAPHWLDALARDHGPLLAEPAKDDSAAIIPGRMTLDEKSFRFVLNEDGVAAERLAEGVRQAVGRLRALRSFASRRLENAFDPLAAPLSQDMG